MENQDLVTICTVTSPPEAEIIRSALESAGIPCTIGGESQAGLAGVLQIDVLTHAEDAERAQEHLKQLEREKKERRKAQIEKRKAKEADKNSEAIQELQPPLPPGTEIQEPPME